MKKLILSLLVLSLVVSSAFAMKKKRNEKKDLIVFAAASMTETLTEIKADYEKSHKNINLVFNFDSSGTLLKQIQAGADCDVFLSAAQKQMNTLENEGKLKSESRKNLLENKTVLAVHPDNQKGLKNFDDLIERLKKGEILLAIGNSDVPVGQYTQKIFAYYQINEQDIVKSLTYGSNVKEVTTQVKSKAADAGIIYATDAYSAGLKALDEATEAMTSGKVIYPISVLKNSKNTEEALSFVNYLSNDKTAKKTFEKVGFTTL